jgi:hypothetical protein
MSKTIVINKIKTLLGLEVKLEQMKLDNGTLIEAEVFEPNQEVFIVNGEERVALPIGTYILEGGQELIVVEEGIIAEIKEAQAEEEAPATEEEAAETPELEAEVATPKKIEKSISETMFFAEIEKLRNEIAELKLSKEEPKKEEPKEIELAEEVKPIVASPESNVEKKQVNLYSQNKGKSVQDNVWNRIANFKNK